jgi:hypothetical protein
LRSIPPAHRGKAFARSSSASARDVITATVVVLRETVGRRGRVEYGGGLSAAHNDNRRDFLFVQSTTEVGGAESVLFNLFENSAALRGRSVVASLSFGDGNLPARLREIGAEVVELPRARLREPVGVGRTLARLRAP